MEFVELEISPHGSYSYKDASTVKMCYLGRFFTSDVGCSVRGSNVQSCIDWAYNKSYGNGFSGNTTFVERDGSFVLISDLYSEEKVLTEFRISIQQFVQLLEDWEEKVCKAKPKQVIIKYENDQFTIETSG